MRQGLELELDVLQAVGAREHLLEAVPPRLRSKPREGAVRGRAGGGEDAGGSLLGERSKEASSGRVDGLKAHEARRAPALRTRRAGGWATPAGAP